MTAVNAAATADQGVPQAVTWRMWVPCIGMAFCSWLSFVDRQVLAVLSPTILKDTGLTPADFGDIVFFFFIAYTLGNPLWGSLLDKLGLRIGMLAAVGIWSLASVSHAWMGTVAGFAMARAVLGLGEGATFPGGLRTAVESLPSHLRARGIATSFCGGTIGAILTPIIVVPVGVKYGWQTAFILTGVLGLLWMILWFSIARPPFLPAVETKQRKLTLPNPLQRRFWAIVFSYSFGCISPGPILTIIPLYLTGGLGLTQADLAGILWMPPLAWGIGYFFWGWAADKYAAENQRPVGMFALLVVCALTFGFTTWTTSVALAITLISFSAFIAGGFQMVALKVGSYSFPREQAAMMTGIASGAWSLVNAGLAPILGRMFGQQRYAEAFWLIAVLPLIGIIAWLFLSRRQTA